MRERAGGRSVFHVLAIALLGALGCAEPWAQQRDASREQPEQVSSLEQALLADPGPKNVFVVEGFYDRVPDARSDGAYLYARYWRDRDRGCWGRVRRTPVGGGAVTVVEAPCGTHDFAIRGDDIYFATTRTYLQDGGIFHATFGVDGSTRLTTSDASAIASDQAYLYWSDGTALHRVRHDGTGEEPLAANAAGSAPLLLDDTSIYGYDGVELWKVAKQSGERTTLATIDRMLDLQLDDRELFWIDNSQLYVDGTVLIQRLSIMGGSPSTFYSTTSGVRGLAVERGWVYWSNGRDIMRRAKTGGMAIGIDTAEPSSEVLAADATNVYYMRWTTPSPPFVALRRLPIADLVAPSCGDKPRALVNATSPLGLATSGTWIYYTERDTVRRVWKNGGSVETTVANQPGARALHADDSSLAWVTDEGVNTTPYQWPHPGSLYAADAEDVISAGDGVNLYYTDGARIVGPVGTTLATGVAPYRLARDDSWLYWTDSGDQTVRRVPLGGGNVELVARIGNGELGDLALGSNQIFFAVQQRAIGVILRVAKTGGATTLVTKGAFSPFDLQVSGSRLYFTSQGPDRTALYRVAKSGGKPVALAKGGAAFELGTLERCVYYATDAGVAVVSGL